MPTDSNLTVSLLKPEEARQYMQIRHETFRPTVNKILYSRGEASPKTLDRVTQEIQEGIEKGILYLKCTDSTNGEVVAGARWRHVKPKEAGAKQRTLEEVEEGFKIPEPYDESDPELVTALHTLFNKHKKEILGTQPYFVLDTLVTHPDHHRRGAGGLLLTWGCERADQEGLEVYLEASPMGEPLYARYGFERIKEITLDLRPFGGNEVMRFILMKRPAKTRTP